MSAVGDWRMFIEFGCFSKHAMEVKITGNNRQVATQAKKVKRKTELGFVLCVEK